MAAVYNFTLDQGSKHDFSVLYKDPTGLAIDLTGYAAALQVRESVDSAEPLVSLTEAAGIALGGEEGTIGVHFTPEETAGLTLRSVVYDLELTPEEGETFRLLQGTITVSPEVTREDE